MDVLKNNCDNCETREDVIDVEIIVENYSIEIEQIYKQLNQFRNILTFNVTAPNNEVMRNILNHTFSKNLNNLQLYSVKASTKKTNRIATNATIDSISFYHSFLWDRNIRDGEIVGPGH
ncbi:hypothetical protein PV328_005760 [Microctonus aethiopoides]|uniref:Uncharacterized protein n=1 Tax=Microctonus aethiopoides TaxID=144406 RepID=A0AA39FNE4_9HYME|nr:hypothetical protein PV328_005760 [Microctonus aethiopoides]